MVHVSLAQILFSSFQFKFAQYYTWAIKNITKHKILLNIFCIVYKFTIRSEMELSGILCAFHEKANNHYVNTPM